MIRKGEARDLEQLLALATALKNESEITRDVSLDREKLSATFKRGFDPDDPHVCVIVYETGSTIRGATVGIEAEYFFSRERYVADLFLYVDPSCRRGLMSGVIARRLWEGFRDWARERGVRELRNGVSTGIAVDAAHRFFLSLGMQHIGGFYRLPLR
jgi:GNAT superfamily N-acetyltransferase